MQTASWIKKKSADSLHPAQVETTLVQLNEAWPHAAAPLAETIENFPLGEAAVLHLLSVSSICATRIVQNPELLLWLAQPEICLQGRDVAEMAVELRRAPQNDVAANKFCILRHWKNKEMTRIALRELANAAALEETTAELSQLAEICVREVFGHWNTKFRESFGSPAADFAILALGKLGGGELNHSSDVDLIFLYSEEGELSPRLSYHQWFNRLAEKILETFAIRDSEGALFRVDLRLRPEGSAGPLARSLESMENYYAGFGETWERIALIKARGIAGDRELAYEFLRQHQPFIYPRSPTPDLLDEIAKIKSRIEHDVIRSDSLERDVKLGRGGIREIEFVMQTLQFIHGGRHIFLRETSTLGALRGLSRLELIPRKEVVDLDRAYRFLRHVEHRLQIEAEQQIHTIPCEPTALNKLARSLGFDSTNDFTAALIKTLDASRFAGDLLIRRPQLLEEITRDKSFNQPRSIAEHFARLESFGSSPTNLDPIRAYRQRQLLRIIMRDVLGVADAPIIFAELSDLAEACLRFTNGLLGGEGLTIIALGKFGGREINYGADLDLLLVGKDTRAAQNLVTAVAQPSSEGTIAAVDGRLRPDGDKGPLVPPLAACKSYYRERAQLWEIHALTRARPLSGPLKDDYLNIAQS